MESIINNANSRLSESAYEDKTFTYCQKSAEIGTADRTHTIEPSPEEECEIISGIKRTDIKLKDYEAHDCSQRSADMSNVFECPYANSIAVARNNVKEIGVEVEYKKQVKAEKNESKSFEVKSEGVENDAIESAKVDNINGTDIESQNLLYHQDPVKAASHSAKFLEEVVDDRPKPVLDEEDTDRYNSFGRNNFLIKDLDKACELWMKKVNELRSITKQDKENPSKEKRTNHHHTNFERSLEDLDKILEIELTNARVLINKENKEKSVNKSPSLTCLSKNKKEALAKLKKVADIGNINEMYSVRYCYQDEFGSEEDEHKAFEHYKKLNDTGNANRAFMVSNCYLGEKNSSELYSPKPCSQDNPSTVKEEIRAFDLNPIANEYSKIKDPKYLENNWQHNVDIRLISAKSEVEQKLEINGAWIEKQINESTVRIEKDDNNEKKRKIMVQWFQHLLTGWSSVQIFDPGRYTHLDPYCHPKETLSKSKELLYDLSAKVLSTLMILQAKSPKRIWRNISDHFAGAQ
ncbi:hypothetical protein C2G38_2157570 [Gigaspora rosea]|uniref:Uncharacterized protein n=1 Tax=Gigaspora rosea TaxID=44941 RepID=A0A397W3F2_9GLOM|nr:hypothetical protein C2G38_2157570 [Gigaspora rosea]